MKASKPTNATPDYMHSHVRWCWRVVSPIIATLVAAWMTLLLADRSFVSEALSDAAYRFPKWWRTIFWRAYYPHAFYYHWQTAGGGHGRARWMWRAPKHPNWKPATDWWVFSG